MGDAPRETASDKLDDSPRYERTIREPPPRSPKYPFGGRVIFLADVLWHSFLRSFLCCGGGGGENLYETPNFRMDCSIFSFSPPSVVIFVRCRRRRQNLKLWIIGFGLEKGALLFVGGLWNWKSPPHLLSSDSFLLQSRSVGPTGDTTARGRKCWKEFARQPLPSYTEVLH